jgi:hypothetical protein
VFRGELVGAELAELGHRRIVVEPVPPQRGDFDGARGAEQLPCGRVLVNRDHHGRAQVRVLLLDDGPPGGSGAERLPGRLAFLGAPVALGGDGVLTAEHVGLKAERVEGAADDQRRRRLLRMIKEPSKMRRAPRQQRQPVRAGRVPLLIAVVGDAGI